MEDDVELKIKETLTGMNFKVPNTFALKGFCKELYGTPFNLPRFLVENKPRVTKFILYLGLVHMKHGRPEAFPLWFILKQYLLLLKK